MFNVTRRKSVVVLMLLMLAVLLTSPWASAPVPEEVPERSPEDAGDTAVEPAFAERPASLEIKIISDETAFRLLERQSDQWARLHPDMHVELTRLDPADGAGLLEDWRHGAEGTDVALVPSAWVKRLAVRGDLLTADAAFEGDALSQQFDGIKAQAKWNGFLWGVPHHLDPYVIVWNRARLSALARPDGSALTLPLSGMDWTVLGAGLAQQNARQWLAIDEADPGALLAWLSAATGMRSERLLLGEAGDWTAGQAVSLMETLGATAGPLPRPVSDASFWQALASGQYAAAVMRQSAAAEGIAGLGRNEVAGLSIDRSGWNKPYTFDAGASFVIDARTEEKEAAKAWIAGMTTEPLQLDNYAALGVLPVYRSAYAAHHELPALSAQNGQQFPNWEPNAAPDWPRRMEKLRSLWSEWRQGRLALADWPSRWSELLADLELHD